MNSALSMPGRLATVRAADLAPADRLFWMTLASLAVVTPLWASASRVTIGGLPGVVACVAGILILRAIYVLVRPGARLIHTLLENAAAIVAYTALLATVSYLCARNDNPPWDATLRAADLAIGFDWYAWAAFVNGSAVLSRVLEIAYASLIPQTILALVILPFVEGGRRGYALIRASTIAALIACAGSYLLPTAGMEPQTADWFAHWAALRGGEPFATTVADMQGIISFPSFHAALAVILMHAMRRLGPITWAFFALNVALLAGTPTYGHHYLVDILAGLAVAAFAIAVTRRLDRLAPAPFLAG